MYSSNDSAGFCGFLLLFALRLGGVITCLSQLQPSRDIILQSARVAGGKTSSDDFRYVCMYKEDISIMQHIWPTRPVVRALHFPHIHHTPDAIPGLHILKRSIDLIQRLPVRDELVDLQQAVQVVVHQGRELRAAFDAAERASFPHAAGDELEC